jgi:hypothetical protein
MILKYKTHLIELIHELENILRMEAYFQMIEDEVERSYLKNENDITQNGL